MSSSSVTMLKTTNTTTKKSTVRPEEGEEKEEVEEAAASDDARSESADSGMELSDAASDQGEDEVANLSTDVQTEKTVKNKLSTVTTDKIKKVKKAPARKVNLPGKDGLAPVKANGRGRPRKTDAEKAAAKKAKKTAKESKTKTELGATLKLDSLTPSKLAAIAKLSSAIGGGLVLEIEGKKEKKSKSKPKAPKDKAGGKTKAQK